MAHELLPPVNEPAILGASKGLHSFDKEHLVESARESKGYYLTSQGITFNGFKNYCGKLIQGLKTSTHEVVIRQKLKKELRLDK